VRISKKYIHEDEQSKKPDKKRKLSKPVPYAPHPGLVWQHGHVRLSEQPGFGPRGGHNSMADSLTVDKSGLITFVGGGETYLYIESLIIEPGMHVGIIGWRPERDEKIFVRNIIGDDINNLRSIYFAHSHYPRKAQAIYQSNGYYQILPSYDNTRWEPPPPIPEPTTCGAALALAGIGLWGYRQRRLLTA